MRNEHLFEFTGRDIAQAAANESIYHDDRHTHWRTRAEDALEVVEATVGARIIRREVTGGVQVDVVVDYGDPEAWREYQLAFRKATEHAEARDVFLQDQATYRTNPDRKYELTRDDVRYYHLGGEPRDD